jgi:hypothetical protein
MLAMISPQTSVKLVGSDGTAVDHVLAMAFADPSMDDDLRRTLNAHEVMSDGEWPDIWTSAASGRDLPRRGMRGCIVPFRPFATVHTRPRGVGVVAQFPINPIQTEQMP